MVKAFYEGFEILEVRDFNNSKWGHTVQINVNSTLYPYLIWVGTDYIELKEVEA